jgi:putative (di)nucleoside polyphosphate hydrolase
VIDSKGFRLNVGIILVNPDNRLFLARRLGQSAWQFPQGGVHKNETLRQALYRELYEEVGLMPCDVKLMTVSSRWLKYRLPPKFIRHDVFPLCVGQKQKWFMLRLLAEDTQVQLDRSGSPEFDAWRWVHYWEPMKQVIDFKKAVYRSVLQEFSPFLGINVVKEEG